MSPSPKKSGIPGEKLPDLLARLRDPNGAVWYAAAKELCQMGAPAIPIMIEFLASDNEDIRGCMAWTLGELGSTATAAVPNLLKLLDDRGAGWFLERRRAYPVRFRAAFAVAKVDPARQEIIPLLREAMNYRKFEYIQGEAHEIIRRLGPRASVFLPELKAAENAPNQRDRVRVQMTLAALDPNYEITDDMANFVAKKVRGLK
jgi:HEAT repeat protein